VCFGVRERRSGVHRAARDAGGQVKTFSATEIREGGEEDPAHPEAPVHSRAFCAGQLPRQRVGREGMLSRGGRQIRQIRGRFSITPRSHVERAPETGKRQIEWSGALAGRRARDKRPQ